MNKITKHTKICLKRLTCTLLKKHQSSSKKTWIIIKEAIGKTKMKGSDFPRKLSINNKEVYDKNLIANSFNDYFVSVGSNLSAKIPNSEKHFSDYLNHSTTSLTEKTLTVKRI